MDWRSVRTRMIESLKKRLCRNAEPFIKLCNLYQNRLAKITNNIHLCLFDKTKTQRIIEYFRNTLEKELLIMYNDE